MGKIKIDKDRLRIQWVDPKTLEPNKRNHRKHPDRQVKLLADSLQDEGWLDPVIVNRGRIVDGHARVAEAVKGGVKEVPAIFIDVDDKTEAKIIARHDQIGALAEIDLGILEAVAAELDLDLPELGWDDAKPLDSFEPQSMDSVARLDEKQMKKCPECGHEW